MPCKILFLKPQQRKAETMKVFILQIKRGFSSFIDRFSFVLVASAIYHFENLEIKIKIFSFYCKKRQRNPSNIKQNTSGNSPISFDGRSEEKADNDQSL